MNLSIQIGAGLLPGAIVTIILLFKRKAFNVNKILFSLLFAIISGGLICYGISDVISTRSGYAQLSQKKMLMFANALVQEGAYSEANDVIEQYSEAYGYDDECRLVVARTALLEGDYGSALHLYEYISENTGLVSAEDEEMVAATKGSQDNASDLIMMEYILSLGEKLEDYGYSKETYESIKNSLENGNNNNEKLVRKAIDANYSISEEASKCAEAVAAISQEYEIVTSGEDGKTTGKYKRLFSEIEKNSAEYLSVDCVSKARLKAYVMAGDYDSITGRLGKESDYHELMIAAELYMSGLVKKSDFTEDFQNINKTDATAVEDRLNKIYRNEQSDLTVQEKKALKSRVQAISKQLDDPALVTIKEQLTLAADNEAGTDGTKVYLELAKIENYFGNETSTDTYLSMAIYSSQDNEDDSYVVAMSQIITVISNDEESETENIKNVSTYVDNVLDHSLTVNVEEIISPQHVSQSDVGSSDREEENNKNFAQAAVDYVSKAKSSITIGRINTDKFEEITATVQIDSGYVDSIDELKNGLRVYDCGAEIYDFDIRKINYTGSNIILVCDVSGSMDGSIQDLKNAVITFVDDKNKNENISIVSFSDSIVDSRSFGASDDELKDFAENMYATGGTDMFSAVVNCLANYSTKDSESNVLILMTDGQDNNPKSSSEIYQEIGQMALKKGVTVYTMGLGYDVDTTYLSTIAESGNGEFVYVSDSSSLTSFYDMLHSQVYSQYEITYKARDTITMSGRTLEVSLPSNNVRDVKTYSLAEEDSDNSLQASQDLSISGMSPRYLYKGIQDANVKLKGTGFNQDSKITVKLNGNIDYDVEATYVDSETYAIKIPSSVAVGNYNVEISIDGKKKILQNGFSIIVQGDEKKTTFGPYVFTSSYRIENGQNNYTLSGSVTLNGWLHFKGDVNIVGDLDNDGSIRVSDYSGSFVEYDSATAEGVGGFLAEKGISLSIPALYDFKLYNDQEHLYDYSKYLVDDISTGVLEIINVVKFDSTVVRLYPNSIGLYYKTGTTVLPYQKQILKACNTEDLFKFTFDGNAQITNKNVGIVLDTSYKAPSDSDSDYNHQINLLNSLIYFNESIDVKINTLKNEYTLGAMVRMDFFAKKSGIGAEVSWKGHLVPDSVKLSLKLAKGVKLHTTIPIEVNKFTFKVSDINKVVENGAWASLKLSGSAEFTSLKVKDYFPELEKFVGDMSVFEMPDTTATIRVSPFTLEATAKLKFLSEITLAEAGVKLGNFDYTNSLLQLDGVNVNGLSASLKEGFIWDSADKRISVEISGTGEFDANTRFVGVNYTGTAKYDISWWLISTEKVQTGTVALGLYTTHDDKNELIFAYRTQDSKGKVRGDFYYIDENGKCGKDNGVLN